MSASPAATGVPVLAIDPGKDKCGVAVVQLEGATVQVLARRIFLAREFGAKLPALIEEFKIANLVLGNATTSRIWHARLSTLLPELEIAIIEEKGSTLEARELYWRQNPPRGWRRVLPLSLQMPPEPIDDFAAVVIAQRYFQKEK